MVQQLQYDSAAINGSRHKCVLPLEKFAKDIEIMMLRTALL